MAFMLLVTILASCTKDPESPSPDTVLPVVWISSPMDSTAVVIPDSIRIAAEDNEAIVRVAAYSNGDSLGEDSESPYSILLGTGRNGIDTLSLTARAWDEAGNMGASDTVTVFASDGEPPIVEILLPAEGAVFEGPFFVHVSAVDGNHVMRVMLFADDQDVATDFSYPFQFTINPADWSAGGEIVLIAKAIDIAGNTGTSAPIGITFNPSQYSPPVPISPSSGEVLIEPDSVRFTWQDHPAPDIRFMISENMSFNAIVIDTLIENRPLTLPAAAISHNYWRLKGGRDGGPWSDWSEVSKITVHEGPILMGGVVTLAAPSNGRFIQPAANDGVLLVGRTLEQTLMIKLDTSGELDWWRLGRDGWEWSNPYGLTKRHPEGWFQVESDGYGGHGETHLFFQALDDDGDIDEQFAEMFGPMRIRSSLISDSALGGIAFLGHGSCDQNSTAIRFSCASGVQWRRDYNGSCWEGGGGEFQYQGYTACAAGLTPSGELSLIGAVFEEKFMQSDHRDLWVQALDPDSGEELWDIIIDVDASNWELMGAEISESGRWIAAGNKSGSPNLLIADPQLGEATWALIQGVEPFAVSRMAMLDASRIVIGGARNGSSLILLCDLSGATLWERILDIPGPASSLHDLVVLPDNDIAAIGTARDTGFAQESLWYRHLDAAGNDIAP